MQLRLPHIDIARGIGILLVVAGHNWIILSSKGELYRVVYSFHIPLFFVLSGIFFNYEKSFIHTVKEKFRVLLVPYFFTAIIVELISSLTGLQSTSLGKSLFWVFYGTGPHLKWVGLWFLPHLFLVSIFCWTYFNIFKVQQLKWHFQIVMLIIPLIVGWLNIRSFWGMEYTLGNLPIKVNGLPFSADILLISSSYFMFGSLAKSWIKNQQVQFIPFVVAAVIFLGGHAITDSSTDLNLRRYDNLIIATSLAIAGSFIVIVVSKWFARFSAVEKILGYLGRNSLIILIFHSFFQDNLFVLLSEYTKRFFYVGLITFVTAIIGSIVVAEIINRGKFLQLIYGNPKPN